MPNYSDLHICTLIIDVESITNFIESRNTNFLHCDINSSFGNYKSLFVGIELKMSN